MRLPSRTSRRRFAAALLAPLAVLVASGCSDSMENAATVTLPASEGREQVVVTLSHDDLNDDLRALRDNDGFMELVRSQSDGVSDSDGSIERQIETQWLSTLIEAVVIDAEADELGIELTDADRDAVREGVQQLFGGAEIFAEFPAWFREEAIDRSARWRAVQSQLAGPVEEPTEAEARAFYEENFGGTGGCDSGLSVAHILVGTQEEAQAIAGELTAGGDFAALASQRSTDTMSAANGGDLGCYQPGSFVAAFEQAVQAATVGVPSAPVQSEYGWHIVLVTEYQPPSFEELEAQILQYLRDQASQQPDRQVLEELSRRLAEAEVTVAPRYGRWVNDEVGARVEPPAAPSVRDQRRPEPEPEQPAEDPFGSLPQG